MIMIIGAYLLEASSLSFNFLAYYNKDDIIINY